jgi:hypothetical protein
MPTEELIFASHALHMRRLGLAVLPIGRNKKPAISSFAKWSRPPGERTVAKWAIQYPAHNIAIAPGLSDVWVADADDLADVPRLEELLGPTPLRVSTGRGKQLYCRKPSQRLPGNLRSFGLNVDLKSGNSLVVAPPSIHDSGNRYAIDGGSGWEMLGDLPRPDVDALRKFIDGRARVTNTSRGSMRDGSRKQYLNDQLCRHACACDCFAELLDVARTLNQDFADQGLAPLGDEVIVDRARKVWADAEAGKLKAWVGRTGVARAEASEIEQLACLDARRGPDAFMLLMRLRVAHTARCQRGETFAITPKAMAREQTIPCWSVNRFVHSRDLLLAAGLVEKAAEFRNTPRGRSPAQYRLTGCGGRGRS